MKDTIIKWGLTVSALVLAIVLVRFALHTQTRTIRPGLQPGDVRVVFGGGCANCLENVFKQVKGVHAVLSTHMTPVNRECSDKDTFEIIHVYFAPKEVSYEELLDLYWRSSKPTEGGVIFYQNDWMKKVAEDSKEALSVSGKFDKEIVTEILSQGKFKSCMDQSVDPEVLQKTKRCKKHCKV